MSLEDLKKVEYGITHNATFHADDVFSAAFLQMINPDIKIIRTSEVPNDLNSIVFDIGFGELLLVTNVRFPPQSVYLS